MVKGDAFRVSYKRRRPRTAMRVTERLASLFIEENLRDREVLAEDTNQFLDSQLERCAAGGSSSTRRSSRSTGGEYAGELPTQLEANLQVMQNTQMQIQALAESMARDRDRRLIIERAIADVPAAEAPAPAPLTSTSSDDEGRGNLRAAARGGAADAPPVASAAQTRASGHRSPAAGHRGSHGEEFRRKPLCRGRRGDVVGDPVNHAGSGQAEQAARAQSELQNIDRQIARKESEEKQLREA